MSILLDGKKVSDEILTEISLEVSALPDKPRLAVVLVGDDPASKVYIRNKVKSCVRTGIESDVRELPADASEREVLDVITELNNDPRVSGILVQQPFPAHLDADRIIFAVDALKDVDCFNPYNVGLVSMGAPRFAPCTPAGVIELLKRYNVEIAGKRCVILGRSNIVGKPAASLFLAENATVTICHSKTVNLADITRQADILVVAIRQMGFVTGDMVKDGAAVVDVGMHDTGKVTAKGSRILRGDVNFEQCEPKASYITPVPKGVGPMTITMLMANCLKAYKLQRELAR
ncbi:MAG: bifunctional methylenetetrahydrofolate dehydrogenase/methenyltetrahydrofolate cyclohydrolase [Defluviitaleaceae bacterium]|nr:bifunctional methylenetetrahydrofolate dehydrogenase/methenyltetrahydrofolate cyclohydrolase [Defluviitaleaceae bacterium]